MVEIVNKLAEQMKRTMDARKAAGNTPPASAPPADVGVGFTSQAEVVAARILTDQQDKDAVVLFVSQIDVQPQARKAFNNIEALAESILSHQQIQPIIVIRTAAHRYRVLDGERRLRAKKHLNHDTILARVVSTELEGLNIRLYQLSANVQRDDYEPMELAREFALLEREHGLKKKDIAKLLHCSESWVYKKLSLLEAPQQVQDLIERGELSESEYYNNRVSIEAKINSLHNSAPSDEAPRSDTKPPRADVRTPMLSIPVDVALALAKWIKDEAQSRGVNPVELGDKPTKKELAAILSRVSELRG